MNPRNCLLTIVPTVALYPHGVYFNAMTDDASHTAPPPPDHRAQLGRLRRVEGQVRGIAAMVEQGRYCVDLLTQLQAARAALGRIERDILDAHVGACVATAAASGDKAAQRAKLAELTVLLRRAIR